MKNPKAVKGWIHETLMAIENIDTVTRTVQVQDDGDVPRVEEEPISLVSMKERLREIETIPDKDIDIDEFNDIKNKINDLFGMAPMHDLSNLATCTNTYEYENGVSKSFGRYAMHTAPDAENLFYGNVFGASEHFWADMMIYEGETDPDILTQKMATGEYVIIGTQLDRLSGGPKETPLTEQLQIGDRSEEHTSELQSRE